MVTSTGSLGMGVSKARGFVLADRTLGRSGRVYVLTGDGELQEGQFWESLQPTANRKLGEITVIVDRNLVQSDTWVSQVSDLGDLEEKFRAFGWAVANCDGHDLRAFAGDAGRARGRAAAAGGDRQHAQGRRRLVHGAARPARVPTPRSTATTPARRPRTSTSAPSRRSSRG